MQLDMKGGETVAGFFSEKLVHLAHKWYCAGIQKKVLEGGK